MTEVNSSLFTLHFSLKICTFDFVESRLHLGKTQINLVFLSICTTFAVGN